ncbi:MAG: nicotinate-nucleotide adenylyltransferase [Clostridia bacterium]|nr:nicotinate-nucleotide adenylyltransferase [Clostridia bacterium]
MKRIGILGGTFDPIHRGHIELACAALCEYKLDKVLVMTGGMPPHKRGEITDAFVRHEMVELALVNEEKIIPYDYEVSKTEYSYTAKTLTELKKIHPDWEIYFIIGEDSLYDLPQWYEPETVVKNCILLVYPRDNNSDFEKLIAERKEQYRADIRPITAPIVEVSSTDIRNRVKLGEDITNLVPDAVVAFIKEKGLYTL